MTAAHQGGNKGPANQEAASEAIREEVATRAGQEAHDRVLNNTEVVVKSNAIKQFFGGMGRTSIVALSAITGIALGAAGTVAIQRRMAARAETPMEPMHDNGDSGVHFEVTH
jgi:hypothetical protein